MINIGKKYFKGICLDSIHKELDIPVSDKLKRNGTFKRGVYYIVGNDLRYTKIKIQTLLWQTSSDKRIYISVFPSFIVKYNKVSTNLIEFISTNVGKGKRVNKVVSEKKFTALLNAKYTETFNCSITSINFVDYSEINLKFKGIFFC